MPGIEQLKKFDKHISSLGNEEKRRKERGDTVPNVPFPKDVPAGDDSLDFEFGLPESEPSVDDPKDDEIEDLFENKEPSVEGGVPDLDDLFVSGSDLSDDDFAGLDAPIPETLAEEPAFEEYSAANSMLQDISLDSEISNLFDSDDNSLEISGDELEKLEVPNSDNGFESDFDNDDKEISLTSELDSSLAENSFIDDSQNDIEKESFNEKDVFSIDSDQFPSAEPDENSFSDIEIPDISGLTFSPDVEPPIEDDFEDGFGDDTGEFNIPGFSDNDFAETSGGARSLNSSGAKLPPNTISDRDYESFNKNISRYPLNLRIAIEEVIGSTEFKDELAMDVIARVVKKDSARRLANTLEKVLDRAIPVPINYERRTVDEYEKYKSSLEYQLKNRIIPGIIGLILCSIFASFLFFLVNRFIYKPVRAEMYYKNGYEMIQAASYSQSEILFNKAVSYKPKKKWFFRYAQSYCEQKQYNRSERMYERLLLRYDYDRIAGLEYARMELYKLQNYEKADYITRAKILDYHVNDEEAMLLLGDISLAWGDDSQKASVRAIHYEKARLQYAELMEQHGQTDLYLSRMLRYFIRTDNLREVIQLKEHFMNAKKMALEAIDLVDLGGYLMDKMYGYIAPSDEYLREYIVDLRSVVEKAVAKGPDIPESHYNMGKYFMHGNRIEVALSYFDRALELFREADTRTFLRILRNIDTYRLEGELYTQKQEYLLAEERFASGIGLFEIEQSVNGLESTRDVGKLYSDLADIDYFISGDLNLALKNYKKAVEHKYDTASNRYKIGYVQYVNKNYAEALGSFIKTSAQEPANRSLLLSMGNVLSLRGDNYAAKGTYEQLLEKIDGAMSRYAILLPQIRPDHGELVEQYMKVANNLAVSLSRIAEQTGNSQYRADSMIQFAESARAWDALSRNQKTMVRLQGSNLAVQNSMYLNNKNTDFKPAMYMDIPRVLVGEKSLEQSSTR